MKFIIPAVLTFVIGFVVGGYAPRRDLERTQKELKEAREAAADRPGATAWAAGLSQMLANRPPPEAPEHHAKPEAPEHAAPALPPPPDFGDDEDDDGRDGGHKDSAPPSFESMRAAMQIRAAQHRQAFLEEANLDGARTRTLDTIIADFNLDLAREAERAARKLEATNGQPPPVRSMVDTMVDLAQVYQRADDKVQRTLSPAEREVASRKKFDLTNQVDVESLRPLYDAIRKMEKRGAVAEDEGDGKEN